MTNTAIDVPALLDELAYLRGLTTTHVEVWPVAADELGIYLISGRDAWRAGPIDTSLHTAVTGLLREHGELTGAALLHGTSDRDFEDEGAVVHTYIAVCGTHGHAGMRADTLGEYEFVREIWPEALPIPMELVEGAGLAPRHGATEQPLPRYIDVLRHAIRHLAWLARTDATNRAALDEHWRAHLADMEPALAGMYEHAL